MSKLSLHALNEASPDEFVRALGAMVEHAPWVAEEAVRSRPFVGLRDVFAAMRGAVLASGPERQTALLRAHPELAGLAARSGSMEPLSVSEQALAGLSALSAERARIFDELNAAYKARFGFPFIIAVRRHGRDSILRQFRQRLGNEAARERETALDEVLRIVAIRLDAAIAADDRLPVVGRLSTHVLDTANGSPASGVSVELIEIVADDPPRTLARAVTNTDGRTDRPLISDQPLPVATYELRFALGDYFRRRGTALADPPFLDIVPVRFAIAEPEGHYHVPLSATPWSYQTYRGS